MLLPVSAVHRWQPGGLTPCGLRLAEVAWNEGRVLDEGVTCKRCLAANERVSRGVHPHPGMGQGELFED